MSSPTLTGIPVELRDKIIGLVLNEPPLPDFAGIQQTKIEYIELPDFTGVPANCVSQQLHIATIALQLRTLNLALITSNGKSFAAELAVHGIPIISCPGVQKLQAHVLRIHVTVPEDFGSVDVVNSSVIVHITDLPSVAKLLRAVSFHFRHDFGGGTDRRGLYRWQSYIKISIHFEEWSHSNSAARQVQVSILDLLAPMNHAGEIKIFGLVDINCASLLSGRTEFSFGGLSLAKPLMGRVWLALFGRDRMEDGDDCFELKQWKLEVAMKAAEEENWTFSELMYGLCLKLKEDSPWDRCDLPLFLARCNRVKVLDFKAEMGLVSAIIGQGHWDRAKANLVLALEPATTAAFLNEHHVEEAEELKVKIFDYFESQSAKIQAKVIAMQYEAAQLGFDGKPGRIALLVEDFGLRRQADEWHQKALELEESFGLQRQAIQLQVPE